MKQTIIAGTNTMLAAGKNLLEQQVISQSQYNEMVMRNKEISQHFRRNIVVSDRR